MHKIDVIRKIDGQAAVFLRYGRVGYVIVATANGERTIERAVWLDLPLWILPAAIGASAEQFS